MEFSAADVPSTYPNLFYGEEQTSMLRGVSILGHPGIGKSVFIDMLLALRLQAKKPTVLLSGRIMTPTIFSADGVTKVTMTRFPHAMLRLPRTTWMLGRLVLVDDEHS
ncbi:hypothetical protein AX16_004141 [Volvariella volvacea WC 439]|nr:hypothetical protein AX16_004141 [Volvariella volvacea WC 439]